MSVCDPASADLPPGEWTHLLVGHQWPGAGALAVLTAAAAGRLALGASHDGYADTLQSIRAGIVSRQSGLTADAAEDAFRRGEVTARAISARNAVKRDCYESARSWVRDLRADLGEIAAAGNAAIRRALDSDMPAGQKLDAIVGTVIDAREQANATAGRCGANVLGAIQEVLESGDAGTSAREFAHRHGVELDRAFGTPNHDAVRAEVTAMMRGRPDTRIGP